MNVNTSGFSSVVGAIPFVPSLPIDRLTYDKPAKHPAKQYRIYTADGKPRDLYIGYERRMDWMVGTPDLNFTVHTTNHPTNVTTFADQAGFLRNAPKVSANYVLGREFGYEGRVKFARILRPDLWVHWCNGQTIWRHDNTRTIAIEVVWTRAWGAFPQDLMVGLSQLILECCFAYNIVLADPERGPRIRTHRHVALPQGQYPGDKFLWLYDVAGWRKTDPAGWSNATFTEWRQDLSHHVYPKYMERMAAL